MISKGTATTDRREKNRRPRNRFEGNCFICGKKGHRAEICRSAKKNIEKAGDAVADKKGRGRGKCSVVGSEEHFAHEHCGLCRSLEHQTHDCEEREAEEGMMLVKMNVSTSSEMGRMAATIGASRGDGKEEWDSDSGATFHTSHTRAGMTAYKKAYPETIVEVTDRAILPVDGFGTIEVDLDYPGTTIKLVYDGCRRVCARTFAGPTVHPQSSGAMG